MNQRQKNYFELCKKALAPQVLLYHWDNKQRLSTLQERFGLCIDRSSNASSF